MPGLMYADDVALLACTRLGLEDNLAKYHAYTVKWRSRLAPDKYHFVVFGAHLRNIPPLVCPGGFLAKPESSAKYLGVIIDNYRSSGPQLDQAKTTGRTNSHLLYQLAHSMGEDFADQVTQRKVLPAALYGLEAGYLNDNALKKLDTITELGAFRAHLLPFSSNTECRRYETPTLPASSLVAVQQANMYIKFSQTPHPIRTPLLSTVSNAALSGASVHAGWARSVRNLRKVGLQLSSNLPIKPLTKHRRNNIVSRLRNRLLHDHTKALTDAKDTVPVRPDGARSKLDLFYRLVGPPSRARYGPPAFSEAAKLALVKDVRHRSILRHIRCGLVGPPSSARPRPSVIPQPVCPCSCDPAGNTVRDPTHLVLECPETEPSRQRVRHALRVTLTRAHPVLRCFMNALTDEGLVLSSLGAPIPMLSPCDPLYEVFIQAAAAAWSSEATTLGVCLRVPA